MRSSLYKFTKMRLYPLFETLEFRWLSSGNNWRPGVIFSPLFIILTAAKLAVWSVSSDPVTAGHLCLSVCTCDGGFLIDCGDRNLSGTSIFGSEEWDLQRSMSNESVTFRPRTRTSVNTKRHEDNRNSSNAGSTLPLSGRYNNSSFMENLGRTQVLSLKCNHIEEILPSAFISFPWLRQLDISWNIIHKIAPSALAPQRHLRELNVSYNNLTTLPNGDWLPSSLRTLDLQGNPLTKLKVTWFTEVAGLRHLNVANCSLDFIPHQLSNMLPNLTKLDVSNNRIMQIAIYSLSYIHEIVIVDNPFHCDCNLVDLRDWLINQTGDVSIAIKCFTPHHLSQRQIVNISRSYFYCNETTTLSFKVTRKGRYHRHRLPHIVATPLPYNPMMGIGTAATLSGMLVLFLLCVVLDKLKRKLKRWCEERSEEKMLYRYSAGQLDMDSKMHTFPEEQTDISNAALTPVEGSKVAGTPFDLRRSHSVSPVPSPRVIISQDTTEKTCLAYPGESTNAISIETHL